MEDMTESEMRAAKMVEETLSSLHGPIENREQKLKLWTRYTESVHRHIKLKYAINSKDQMEKLFVEWSEWVADSLTDYISKGNHDVYWLVHREVIYQWSRKNNEKATDLKEQGNCLFKKKHYAASIEKFTESARYATSDGDHFSMAIGNRSAAFFYMCRYKESLHDTELAIKTGYPEGLSWKLHLRAARSHLKLRQGKLAEVTLAELRKSVDGSDEIPEAMRESILKQVKDLSFDASACQKENDNIDLPTSSEPQSGPEDMLEKNSTFPYASSAVVLKCSPTRGRYVVAGQSIKKGDVLFAEKPFAWIPPKSKDFPRCAHCFNPMNDAPVPCRGCLDASYCNSTCWNDAWAYHRWECPSYALAIWQDSMMESFHLAFKIFLMSITTTDIVWFNDAQKLVTNVDKMSTICLTSYTAASLLLASYLEYYTNFFDTVDLKKCHLDKFTDPNMSFDFDLTTKIGKKHYVASMILRHSLHINANSFLIDFMDDLSIHVDKDLTGSGAYPSASMLNHSCDPTGIQSYWNNWLIIKATKDIRQGEEISIGYEPCYTRIAKDERQQKLREQYNFDCQCSICTNPLLDNYPTRFESLKCPKCCGPAQLLSDSNSQRCFDCGATGRVTCSNALNKATELYIEGVAFGDIHEWKEAISYFQKCLIIREKHLYRYNKEVAITLSSLGTSYATIGNWRMSMSYLERSLAASEGIYGTDAPEIANELNTITDIYIQFLTHFNSKGILKQKVYREMLVKTREYLDRYLAIIDLMWGFWSDRFRAVSNKREQLIAMMEQHGI